VAIIQHSCCLTLICSSLNNNKLNVHFVVIMHRVYCPCYVDRDISKLYYMVLYTLTFNARGLTGKYLYFCWEIWLYIKCLFILSHIDQLLRGDINSTFVWVSLETFWIWIIQEWHTVFHFDTHVCAFWLRRSVATEYANGRTESNMAARRPSWIFTFRSRISGFWETICKQIT
jgi:hypothetical protein